MTLVLRRELRKALTTRLGSDSRMKIPTKRWITLKSTPLNFPRATSLKAQLTQRIQKLNLLLVSAMNLFTLLDVSTSTALR